LTGHDGPVADKGLVLVVEDEPAIAELQRMYLAREGYGVHVERDGLAGLSAARRLRPVAVVLDVGLPGMDGTEVCRTLREEGDWVPVLFVTARDDEIDRVLGLELGADDYLTKPFSPRELVSRVRAVLRRTQGSVAQPPLTLGPVRLDLETRQVTVDDIEVLLTVTEFDLLAALLRRPGRVLSREQLLSTVWGYEAAAGTRTVDVHVGQVRAKLGPAGDLIRTVRGVGYSTTRS
jgi:DNA-binding response OmpR family regulator